MAIEKKFVREQINRLLIKEFLMMETERAGFGGIDIQRTPMGTRVSLVAERPGMIIGRRGSNITRLTADLAANFKAENPQIEVIEAGRNANLNAHIMARKVAEALERGWHFRRAGHSTVRRIMESGAKGCIVILSGKLTGQRHRVEKFIAGHIKYNGDTALQLMDVGYSQCKKKLGTIGCTVKIMHPDARLPDEVIVYAPGEKAELARGGRRPERAASTEEPTPAAEGGEAEAPKPEGEAPKPEATEEKPERKSRRREPTPVVSEADIKAAEEHAKKRAAEKQGVKPEAAPAEKASEKPAEKAAEKPADKPAETPAEKPAEQAAEKPADAAPAAETPTEEPVDTPTETPADAAPAAPKPAKKATEKAAKAEPEKTTEAAGAPKETANAEEETPSRPAKSEAGSESTEDEKSSDKKTEEESS